MNHATLDQRGLTADWKAVCPKCDGHMGPQDMPCPNCEKRALKFFREHHSTTRARGGKDESVDWTECGLECSFCKYKYRSLPCAHDCGLVLGVPSMSALLWEGQNMGGKTLIFTLAMLLATSPGSFKATDLILFAFYPEKHEQDWSFFYYTYACVILALFVILYCVFFLRLQGSTPRRKQAWRSYER